MWKILNKLFGWDYIVWRNCADTGKSRVRVDAGGVVFYYLYWGLNITEQITHPNQVLWLTCHPSKYLRTEIEKL